MGPSPSDPHAADPFRHVDLASATRIGAAMGLVGFVAALVTLFFSPPRGAVAVASVAVFLAACAAAALHLWRRPEPASPRRLLAMLLGAFVLAAVHRAAGGAQILFAQLLWGGVLCGCAVFPVARGMPVIVATVAASLTPLLYEDVTEAVLTAHLSQVLLILCLGAVMLGWMERVRRSRAQAEAAHVQADELARVDALTGIANRRALEERLPQAIADARRHEEPVSVLVADLDGFRAVNDRHGHQAGDDLLRSAVRGLAAALRLSDPCFRYGGDEFVAILQRAAGREAAEVAARVQSAIALACRTPAGTPLRVSVGTATLRDGETADDLVARADRAMSDHKARRRQRSAAVSSASAASC